MSRNNSESSVAEDLNKNNFSEDNQFINSAFEKNGEEIEELIEEEEEEEERTEKKDEVERKLSIEEVVPESLKNLDKHVELDLSDSLEDIKIQEKIEYNVEKDRVHFENIDLNDKPENTNQSKKPSPIHFFTKVFLLRQKLLDIFKKVCLKNKTIIYYKLLYFSQL